MRDLKSVSWQHRKKLKSIDILAKNTRQRQKTLLELVWRHELTESLEILERYGFEGDLGIFMVGQFQDRIMRGAAQ